MHRDPLAARQASLAHEYAATRPGLDHTLSSLDLLVDAEPTEAAIAYVGEVVLAAAPTGTWTFVRGTAGVQWDMTDGGECPAVEFELRGLFGPSLRRHAADLVEFGLDPTEATRSRLWPDTLVIEHQPGWLRVVRPLLLVYAIGMFAILWWLVGFGIAAGSTVVAFLVTALRRRR